MGFHEGTVVKARAGGEEVLKEDEIGAVAICGGEAAASEERVGGVDEVVVEGRGLFEEGGRREDGGSEFGEDEIELFINSEYDEARPSEYGCHKLIPPQEPHHLQHQD